MWRDLVLVARLRQRQLASLARYWLRTLGCEPGSRSRVDRAYLVYLALLGGWWAAAMLALAVQGAVQLGRALPGEAHDALRQALPWLVLAGQALVAGAALRSSPLRLTFPDVAYLAGTPLHRGALALTAWGLAVARILAATLLAGGLAALALAEGAAPAALLPAAGSALALALPLVAFTVSVAWCLALAGRGKPKRTAAHLAWLVPAALLAGGWFLPGMFLWPGRALALAVAGLAPACWAPLLWLALLPVVGLLACVGERAHMAMVARESETYARIQALGMGAWLEPEVARSIRRRARLAARRPFLRLPGARGAWALAGRTGLMLARDPGALLSLLVWGALIAEAGAWLVGPGAYPPQWAAWLAMAAFAPPAALRASLRADAGDPFLRQLLPQSNLRLLVADTGLPALALTLAALACWLMRRPGGGVAVAGTLTIVGLTALLALCQGVGSLPVKLFGWRLPYEVAAMASLGAVVLAGSEAHAPLAALAVAAVVALALLALIRRSARIAAAP